MLPAYTTDKNVDYYKAIFDNSLTAIISTIPDGTIIDANQAAVDLFGYTIEEMRKIGRSLLFDCTTPEFISLLTSRNCASNVKGEIIGIRKNGQRFFCDMSSVVYLDENGENRTIVNLVDLSERRLVEKDLFEKQQLLNAVVENSNEGIAVTDREGHFLIFNKVMADLLGCQAVDSKKYDWAKAFNIYNRDGVKKVQKDQLPIVRALKGESVKDEIYLIKNPKKGDVYLSVSASPIKDQSGKIIGSLVVDRDITNQFIYQENLRTANEQLTQTMNSLLASNERFNYVLKATNDAIWDMDLTNYRIQWGEGYEKLFGYKTKNNEGHYLDWQSKIHPDDRIRVTKSIETLIGEKGSNIWENEYRYIKSDGKLADIFDRGYVIYSADNMPIRMIGAMQDITSEKKYEIERSLLIDDLLQQNKNFEQFTYIISHNLRSPVTTIISCAEILKDEDLTKTERDTFVNGLSESSNKLDEVIKDLHTILQIKNNTSEGLEIVNLLEIFNDVEKSLNTMIIESNAVINTNFKIIEVLSVKSFIYSIFLNLISNSIKYRKENIPPVIEIVNSQIGNNLYMSFKDNGLGIDLSKKGKDLFGLYKRFHSHVEGKGLGLFMVKTQIETMKGKISVESKLQEGTEFEIMLPIN